jgi:uncharacterized protein YyaL (SSP411 family)
MSTNTQNRLAGETSPYLLQHADNPVDWYPWGEEALALARREDKPILLSIGYSACHWCHVMAHESFEDPATAKLMNERFVNIKVDREERPDIDRIYQTAHQILTQRGGGWPLTMFLDPEDQRPFFGGTYFPREARYGMPSFTELLGRVAEHYRDNRSEVRAQSRQLADVFPRLDPAAIGRDRQLDAAPLSKAREAIAANADREYGGLGSAPKFPHPSAFDRLLRHWRDTAHGSEPDVEALFLVSLTCSRMAEGGIYDQLGGGFCRYSVDRYWQIPHFEKMLYDNGPLLALYAQLYIATGEELFGRIARETAGYLLEDLQSETGGFYSSRDADSEGEEGRFYVWTRDEVRALLDPDDYDLFARHFGLDGEANFEGRWHLTVRRSLADLAKEIGEDQHELRAIVDRCRARLLEARSRRVAPGRDEKQLTAWNALAIRGLAIAGRSLGDAALIDAAARAADFVRTELMRDGRLYASYKDGRARFTAYLDDHAFMLDALLELLQARWDGQHLALAIRLAELLLEQFLDPEDGGFFFTANDAESLMARPKPLADEAMPSGNGIAACALQRLGFLLGEPRYLDAAEKTLRFGWQAMDEYPHGHASLITALEEYLEQPEIIVLRGDSEEILRWQMSAARLYAPRRLVFAIPATEEGLPGALAERAPVDGGSVAYRCRGNQCSLPVTSWEALAAQISERRA